jgi:hypothetical protein
MPIYTFYTTALMAYKSEAATWADAINGVGLPPPAWFGISEYGDIFYPALLGYSVPGDVAVRRGTNVYQFNIPLGEVITSVLMQIYLIYNFPLGQRIHLSEVTDNPIPYNASGFNDIKAGPIIAQSASFLGDNPLGQAITISIPPAIIEAHRIGTSFTIYIGARLSGDVNGSGNQGVCRGFSGGRLRIVTDIPSWTINAWNNIGGSINPFGSIDVIEHDNQTFIMTPDPNNYLADLIVDGVSVGHPLVYTFTDVIADHTIQAVFAYRLPLRHALSRGNQ